VTATADLTRARRLLWDGREDDALALIDSIVVTTQDPA